MKCWKSNNSDNFTINVMRWKSKQGKVHTWQYLGKILLVLFKLSVYFKMFKESRYSEYLPQMMIVYHFLSNETYQLNTALETSIHI